MRDLFSEYDPTCPVCGRTDCTDLPDGHVPHASDRARVPHVLAPHDVWVDQAPGARMRAVTAGDPVPLHVAEYYGWTGTEPVLAQPAARRRRTAPPPRAVE